MKIDNVEQIAGCQKFIVRNLMKIVRKTAVSLEVTMSQCAISASALEEPIVACKLGYLSAFRALEQYSGEEPVR